MEKILDYFTIDDAFGGNQEWFTNVVMYIGGCGAATACDSCIYFAKYMGMEKLYPYDICNLNKDDYKKFSQIMKPYIRPRVGGVKKLEWYMEGLRKYMEDVNAGKGIPLKIKGFVGSRSYEESACMIKSQIDAGMPVPYLMLKHKNEEAYKDFIWHWFLVVGYEETKEGMKIIVATYGEKSALPLKELWDTGYEEKGGMIIYSLN
ncbi:hypothetical protein ACQRBN_06275 [Bariatricus sp. SGI.154]|uniref:hypothetical protein n=1 Tax=Bariatricus sp. SGI.154 TaxID=3420549 RepID=UPI003D02E6AF